MGRSATTSILSGSSSTSIDGRPSSGAQTSLGSSSSSGSTVTITTDDTNHNVLDTSSTGARTRADLGGSISYSYTTPQHQQDSDMQLLSALISPQRQTSLSRLSWTSYEYEAGDFEAGMAFYTPIIGPKQHMVSAQLEHLEWTLCAKDLMGGVTGKGDWWGIFGVTHWRGEFHEFDYHLDHNPPQVGDSGMQLSTALVTPQRRTTSLRRLNWTSYEYEARHFASVGMAFYTCIIGPKLQIVSAQLRVDAMREGSHARRIRLRRSRIV
ncbi:hypothetical protein BKA70DRAFT_1514033 [Coprinopsis sp. MPI-PUGE-AT-0042]|nr:hypothetical protein BKA70DRAFT_1514033 [Coprinopsis sp. MPI-PUGE-AT-0042]